MAKKPAKKKSVAQRVKNARKALTGADIQDETQESKSTDIRIKVTTGVVDARHSLIPGVVYSTNPNADRSVSKKLARALLESGQAIEAQSDEAMLSDLHAAQERINQLMAEKESLTDTIAALEKENAKYRKLAESINDSTESGSDSDDT